MTAPTIEPINNVAAVKTDRSHPARGGDDMAADELVLAAPEAEPALELAEVLALVLCQMAIKNSRLVRCR
jgi:hypothetical protein